MPFARIGTTTARKLKTDLTQDTLERVYNSMRILRYRRHSAIPVEIFSFPEEMQAGPGEGIRGKIEELGNVTFKTLHSSQKMKIWKVCPRRSCDICA